MPTKYDDEALWLCPSLDDSANDLSGNSNNGTYNGGMGTESATGAGGSKAYRFDDVDDYISVADHSSLDLTTLTMAAWVKVDAVAVNNYIFSKHGVIGDETTASYGLALTSETSQYAKAYTRSSTTLEIDTFTASALNDTGWHHVMVTIDGTNNKLYIDGALSETLANTTVPQVSTGDLLIGWFGRSTSYFDGLLDDLRIFPTVKVLADAQALYDSGNGRGYEPAAGIAQLLEGGMLRGGLQTMSGGM